MATRLHDRYVNEAVPALQQKFGYKNVMEIPKLVKVIINMGLGDCKDNAKALEAAVAELTQISGIADSSSGIVSIIYKVTIPGSTTTDENGNVIDIPSITEERTITRTVDFTKE